MTARFVPIVPGTSEKIVHSSYVDAYEFALGFGNTASWDDRWKRERIYRAVETSLSDRVPRRRRRRAPGRADSFRLTFIERDGGIEIVVEFLRRGTAVGTGLTDVLTIGGTPEFQDRQWLLHHRSVALGHEAEHGVPEVQMFELPTTYPRGE